jgi:hypothetical protein
MDAVDVMVTVLQHASEAWKVIRLSLTRWAVKLQVVPGIEPGCVQLHDSQESLLLLGTCVNVKPQPWHLAKSENFGSLRVENREMSLKRKVLVGEDDESPFPPWGPQNLPRLNAAFPAGARRHASESPTQPETRRRRPLSPGFQCLLQTTTRYLNLTSLR